jgi:hypothetical protein
MPLLDSMQFNRLFSTVPQNFSAMLRLEVFVLIILGRKFSVVNVRVSLLGIFILALVGCGYRFGISDRTLPGGYSQVAIPVFKNKSADVGIETSFTNALIRRFARSQVARVSDKESSPLLLLGEIVRVETIQGPAATNKSAQLPLLPENTVLTTEYRLKVTAHLVLKRKSDEKILWQGDFTNEKVYAPPRIGTAVVNSANATYNQSARMDTLARLADEMMAEAHDRLTENF